MHTTSEVSTSRNWKKKGGKKDVRNLPQLSTIYRCHMFNLIGNKLVGSYIQSVPLAYNASNVPVQMINLCWISPCQYILQYGRRVVYSVPNHTVDKRDELILTKLVS